MSEIMESRELLIVTWSYKPFQIEFSYVGTKEEIYNRCKVRDDCILKCIPEEFERTIDNMTEDEPKTYEDKYHGMLVATPNEFSSTEDAETYVKRRYGNVW